MTSPADDGRKLCPECGRWMAPRNDGQLRGHRVTADEPLAAWCSGGAPKPKYVA